MTAKRLVSLLLTFVMFFTLSSGFVYSVDSKPQFKNVIFMIGDGMGENHLNWVTSEQNIALNMNRLPYKGYSMTDSLSGTTDSAAGGTALSCGLRTDNGNVGMYCKDVKDSYVTIVTFKNLVELAMEKGMKTGVLTSDSNTGATPAAFSAHVQNRGQAEWISEQQLDSGLDLIWSENDGYVNEENAAAKGWQYVDAAYKLDGLKNDVKTFGQFSHVCYDDSGKSTSPLSVLTEAAINRLDNENGFFLMVEGAHIDKYSHNNDKDGMMKSLIEFDKAVGAAVKFAENDGETLVVVTADHETGGITKGEDGTYSFTTGSHTNANVPLRFYAKSGLNFEGGAIENRKASRMVANLMGGGRFPRISFNFNIISDFFKIVFRLIKK